MPLEIMQRNDLYIRSGSNDEETYFNEEPDSYLQDPGSTPASNMRAANGNPPQRSKVIHNFQHDLEPLLPVWSITARIDHGPCTSWATTIFQNIGDPSFDRSKFFIHDEKQDSADPLDSILPSSISFLKEPINRMRSPLLSHHLGREERRNLKDIGSFAKIENNFHAAFNTVHTHKDPS
ncbi:hypothetical protein CVT25_008663 [Psilocybe cyanescens]|uniref:Uncharacterized protein n=1 Tax=Psilocybe cyanescens TaxID=93625 RepID=A0A409XNT4_PSICY|nr:hypothetical protein CVT25_008663 [Psilocybe cyanescens]